MDKIITTEKDFLLDEEKLRATIATINFDYIDGKDQSKYFYIQNHYLFNRHVYHIVSNIIEEMHSVYIKNIILYKKIEKERRDTAIKEHAKDNSDTTYLKVKTEINFEHYLYKYNVRNLLDKEIKEFLIDTQTDLKTKRKKINVEEIKRAQLSITNMLLKDILTKLVGVEDGSSRLKSTHISGLDTYSINTKIHNFYFLMEELKNKLDIKKAENDFIKIKGVEEKNLENLDLRETRFKEKLCKVETSLINKIKRAEEDIELHLEEIDEDKKATEKKRLLKNIKTDKTKLSEKKEQNKIKIKKFTKKIAMDREKLINPIKSAFQDYLKAIRESDIKIAILKENKLEYSSSINPGRLINEKYFFPNPLKCSTYRLSSSELKNIKRKKPDLIFDVLNYLKAYGLIIQEDNPEDKSFYYKLNFEEIFKKAEHPINDSSIFSVNVPLILAYLKYSPNHTVKAFIDKIDILLAYSLKPPEEFSKVKENEDVLIQAARNEKSINISLENQKSIYQVEDFHIYYDDDYEKYLSLTIPHLNIDSIDSIYYTNKYNKHITILKKEDKFYKNKLLLDAIAREEKLHIEITSEIILSDVLATIKETGQVPEIKQDEEIEQNKKVEAIKSITLSNAYSNIKFKDIQLIELYINSEKSNSNTDQSISKQTSGFITHQQKYCLPDKGEHNTVLEVDIHLTDFFEIKPLKNQTIYRTPKEIEDFLMKNALDFVQIKGGDTIKRDTKNKVYVAAKDTKKKIIHVLKRCIPNVKILEPSFIKEEYRAILKSVCDE